MGTKFEGLQVQNFEKISWFFEIVEIHVLRRLTTFNDLNGMNNDSFRCILKSANCHAYQAYYFRTLITEHHYQPNILNLVTICNLIFRDDVANSVAKQAVASKLKNAQDAILRHTIKTQ